MKVKELLCSKDKWTQGIMASDANEDPVLARSGTATKWCLLGAVVRCYDPNNPSFDISPVARAIVARLCDVIRKKYNVVGGYLSLPEFNDTHTFDEIKAILDEADV